MGQVGGLPAAILTAYNCSSARSILAPSVDRDNLLPFDMCDS